MAPEPPSDGPSSPITAKIDKFRRIVEKQPENELALFTLGRSLVEAGRHQEAEPFLERALRLKEDWVVAGILRAQCLLRLRRFEEARGLLEEARGHSIEQGHEAPVEEIDELLEDLPESDP